MTTPTSGPGAPEPQPPPTPSSGGKPIEPHKSSMLDSPFARMFAATGAMPTVKQMTMIINGILKQQVDQIKQQDAQAKKNAKKLRDAIEGKD